MKKFTRIAAFVFAACLCAVSVTACGTDKKSNNISIEDLTAEDLDSMLDEYAASELEEEANEAVTEAVTEPAEIVYEPSEEIKNASLRSGYIQIGNTIFREGGYLTVSEFIEKYNDKFDLSEIHTDEYIPNLGMDSALCYSTEDGNIGAEVIYKKPGDREDRVKVSDCIVTNVQPIVKGLKKDHEKPYYFYPTGLTTPDYDTLLSCFNDLELKKIDSEYSNELDTYNESYNHLSATINGEETNIRGEIPYLSIDLKFDEKTLEFEKLTWKMFTPKT